VQSTNNASQSSGVISQTPELQQDIYKAKGEVEGYFREILSNIDGTLSKEQLRLKKDDQFLQNFVETKILPFWDVELTLRLLVGTKQWKCLKDDEVSALKKAFVDTLHRYVREGVKMYDGQRANFVDAILSDDATKGKISVRLEPIYLPAFQIHFKIAKREQQWKLYDVFVEGVSYVKLKKNQYRQIIHKSGVTGLLTYLESKNIVKT